MNLRLKTNAGIAIYLRSPGNIRYCEQNITQSTLCALEQ